MSSDIFYGIVCDDPSAGKDHHAVRPFDIREVLRNYEKANAALRTYFIDMPPERGPGPGIELGGRLVENDKARPGGEHCRKSRLLPRSAGKGVNRLVKVPDETEPLRFRPDPSLDLLGFDTDVLEPERDILADRRPHDLMIGVLEEKPYSRLLRFRLVACVRTVDRDSSGDGQQQAFREKGERRFPRAVVPSESDALSGAQTKRNLPDDDRGGLFVSSVTEADLLEADH
ncbi:MAG: hypothetical protein BWY66_00112 [bacterium ADurb.Bin374]|nr:MAG: hypothetical protein BWY66_00112 [bacterium ADurb.Bin374]